MPLPKSLLTAATLGTDQSILDTTPIEVRSVVRKGSIPSPQARLLATAAGLNFRERAGWVPPTDPRPLPNPCELDLRRRCSPQALHHLQVMLKGHHRALLCEWLQAVNQYGLRVPEEAAHLLLDAGAADRDLRDLIRPIVGKRGKWINKLASNPDWYWFQPRNIDQLWEIGTDNERIELIHYLRKTDPDWARELVSASWDTENAKNRFRFVKAFSDGLSMDDEPLLEATFDEGSPLLRKKARDLLTKLPESRFRQRMLARAVDVLELVERDGIMMVELIPPHQINEALQRDDVVRKHSSPHEVSLNIISHVPPRFWCEHWGLSADDFILAIANNPEWENKLFEALTHAAYNDHDTIFAEQLFHYAFPILSDQDRELLVATLSPQKIEMEAIHLLQTQPGGFHNGHLAMSLLFPFSSISRARDKHLDAPRRITPHQTWSVTLTRTFLLSLQRYFASEEVKVFDVINTRTMLKQVAIYIPIELRDAYLKVFSVKVRPRNEWHVLGNEIRDLLNFRAEMLEAIKGTDNEFV